MGFKTEKWGCKCMILGAERKSWQWRPLCSWLSCPWKNCHLICTEGLVLSWNKEEKWLHSSVLDDFEEINLGESGEEEVHDSSFEEIDLLDLEETYGTKRCNCVCHDSGDDMYKKRKKHCYKCCLTVSRCYQNFKGKIWL